MGSEGAGEGTARSRLCARARSAGAWLPAAAARTRAWPLQLRLPLVGFAPTPHDWGSLVMRETGDKLGALRQHNNRGGMYGGQAERLLSGRRRAGGVDV